jgi:hypothetical protein
MRDVPAVRICLERWGIPRRWSLLVSYQVSRACCLHVDSTFAQSLGIIFFVGWFTSELVGHILAWNAVVLAAFYLLFGNSVSFEFLCMITLATGVVGAVLAFAYISSYRLLKQVRTSTTARESHAIRFNNSDVKLFHGTSVNSIGSTRL